MLTKHSSLNKNMIPMVPRQYKQAKKNKERRSYTCFLKLGGWFLGQVEQNRIKYKRQEENTKTWWNFKSSEKGNEALYRHYGKWRDMGHEPLYSWTFWNPINLLTFLLEPTNDNDHKYINNNGCGYYKKT